MHIDYFYLAQLYALELVTYRWHSAQYLNIPQVSQAGGMWDCLLLHEIRVEMRCTNLSPLNYTCTWHHLL